MRTARYINKNYHNKLRFLGNSPHPKKSDDLRTTIQEGNMKTRQMTPFFYFLKTRQKTPIFYLILS